uniref:RING-type E3 ubiquitin transferase n=1 Tax=Davidia involucrata TaxID=16924 RepID=A0A5B6Z1R5_DAVIN
MPILTAEHARQRRPRNQPTSISDPKPKKTHSLSQSSTRKSTIYNLFHSKFSNKSNNSGSDESREPLTKKPKKKMKIFASMTLRGLGCGAASPASAPAIILSAADWEVEKVRKKKKKKKMKKQRKTTTSYSPNTPLVVVVDVPEICCAPGVCFASDVVPRARVNAQRRTHRERSCTRRRIANLDHVSASDLPSSFDTISGQSDGREYRQRPPGGLPERSHTGPTQAYSIIPDWTTVQSTPVHHKHLVMELVQMMMFQSNLLSGGHLDGHDLFRDWRLDVDSMSYEELLDLSDRIGYVDTGLQEDEIFCCLRKTDHSVLESLPLLMFTDKDWKCSICQEGCRAEDEIGRLDCGHYHHLNCIKQWLLQKNACPVCKTAAVADK